MSLPRSWRALSGKTASLQLRRNSRRSAEHCFFGEPERFRAKGRRRSSEEVARRLVGSISCDAVVRNVIADSCERLGQHPGPDDIVRKDGLRMDHRGVPALLDVDDAVVEGNPLHLSELVAAPLMKRFTAAELNLLRRESIAMHGRFGRPPNRAHKRQARDPGPLFE